MASAFFAADFSSVITSLREGMLMYVGRKPCSTSTPSSFLGRSMTCPMDAFTRKSDPRYLLIVFALAGDSTITSDLPISPICLPLRAYSSQPTVRRQFPKDSRPGGRFCHHQQLSAHSLQPTANSRTVNGRQKAVNFFRCPQLFYTYDTSPK